MFKYHCRSVFTRSFYGTTGQLQLHMREYVAMKSNEIETDHNPFRRLLIMCLGVLSMFQMFIQVLCVFFSGLLNTTRSLYAIQSIGIDRNGHKHRTERDVCSGKAINAVMLGLEPFVFAYTVIRQSIRCSHQL